MEFFTDSHIFKYKCKFQFFFLKNNCGWADDPQSDSLALVCRTASNTSFEADFLNVFRSNMSIKLVTGYAKIELNNFFLLRSSFSLFSFPWFLLLLLPSVQFKNFFKYDRVQISRLFLVSFVSLKQQKLSLLSCMLWIILIHYIDDS